MKMDTDLIHAPAVGLTEEEEADMNDWKLPLAFMKKRHLEKIEGSKALAQSWRMKDRVNIWLVRRLLCLSFCAFFLSLGPSRRGFTSCLCFQTCTDHLMLVVVQGPNWSFPSQTLEWVTS